MIPHQYIWLVWALLFLIPWSIIFYAFPHHRKTMWTVSLVTALFGLTEPLFVPEYWNPPTLFDLAQRTGFDLESLIFCFGIGGVGSVLYSVITRHNDIPIPESEKHLPLHRHHYKALASPFIAFALLYFLPWNPIYPGIAAMAIGAIATVACRPDLKIKIWVGGLLFLAYYIAFFMVLEATAPGYTAHVWNLSALTGILLFGIPLEELLFAFTFGLYWSGVYEHLMWQKIIVPHSNS
ncbi:MAG: lycopene cyclase domain-containing protein [Methylotenera sp.]|nr:lycopene cyclase domain-containing protein [Methylotenera sp.]